MPYYVLQYKANRGYYWTGSSFASVALWDKAEVFDSPQSAVDDVKLGLPGCESLFDIVTLTDVDGHRLRLKGNKVPHE